MTIDSYAITRREVEAALARDNDTLDDYDPTIFGLVWDGVEWQVLEDSLDEEEALAWAGRCAGYGEHVGLFRWAPWA